MTDEKWMVDGPKIIELGAIRRLKVALSGGQIDIVGHDEPTTRVEVHSVSGNELRVALTGDSLEIDHPQVRWDNVVQVFRHLRGSATADLSIMVPRVVALKFGVVSAGALISGLTGDATISTLNGDIVLDRMIGDLTLNAVGGELSVRNHEGSIVARTVGGDITATGTVSRFSADGVSSDVFLDFTGATDEIRVNTVSGGVTARLEDGFGADYRINTVSGRIQLDDTEIKGIRGSYHGKYGSRERTWLELRANTVSGDITVMHAAPEKTSKARKAESTTEVQK